MDARPGLVGGGEAAADARDLGAAAHEAQEGRIAGEERLDDRAVDVVVAGDDDDVVAGAEGRELAGDRGRVEGMDEARRREALGVQPALVGIGDDDLEADGGGERRQRVRDVAGAEEDEARHREDRLDEAIAVEAGTPLAGGVAHVLAAAAEVGDEDARPALGAPPRRLGERDRAGPVERLDEDVHHAAAAHVELAVQGASDALGGATGGDAARRLDDLVLDAAAANRPGDSPLGRDENLRGGVARRRAGGAKDGRERCRRPGSAQARRFVEEIHAGIVLLDSAAMIPWNEPFDRFGALFERARGSETNDPTAMSLGTATRDGAPSVRIVLLKSFDPSGFVFYTNRTSRKGDELEKNPRAALCIYYPSLGEQVRVEGTVERVTEEESDAYFASRERESQLGAWASRQSRPLERYELLAERLHDLDEEHAGKPVPRPRWWGGYRVRPTAIEFWKAGKFRLHHRERYVKEGDGWRKELLNP